MFERFSENARKVMKLAQQEAMKLNHDYIGTEHMLLALVTAGGAASSILEAMGASAAKIQKAVGQIVKPGPSLVTHNHLTLTPRAKSAIDLSIEEAGTDETNPVGTTHLLFGLLREDGWAAARVLKQLGVTLEKLREHVGARCPTPKAAAPSTSAADELKEGMRLFFRQPNGNTLEVFVKEGSLFVTDAADHALVGITLNSRMPHLLQITSCPVPPKPESKPA